MMGIPVDQFREMERRLAARNAKPVEPGVDGDAEREAELHEQIKAECRARGWMALSSRMDSPTGRPMGEPDFIILANGGRVLFVECKTRRGKLTPVQHAFASMAARLGHEIHLVRSIAAFRSIADSRV